MFAGRLSRLKDLAPPVLLVVLPLCLFGPYVHIHADPPWRAPGSSRWLGVQTRDVLFSR